MPCARGTGEPLAPAIAAGRMAEHHVLARRPFPFAVYKLSCIRARERESGDSEAARHARMRRLPRNQPQLGISVPHVQLRTLPSRSTDRSATQKSQQQREAALSQRELPPPASPPACPPH